MNYIESSRKIRQLMAKASNTDPDDWFLCLKARFGMQVVFRQIRETLGDGEVITSPYTCITAVNPIITAGLTPVYSDISEKNLSIDKPLAKLSRGNTHAIVMQHTLGIIGNKTNIADYANKHHLLLIEDSAHCLTRMARNDKNEILADISIHSFGVEKVLTRTKFGGLVYVNPRLKASNLKLYENITTSLLALPQPTSMTGIRLRTYRLNNAVLQRMPSTIKPSFRSATIKAHILEPPIYPFEQEAKQGKAYTSNLWVNTKILEQLPTLPINYERRLKNVAHYKKNLSSDKFKTLTNVDEPLLAYPILFADKKHANMAYDLLTTAGYFIRRWYSPLLFPGPKSNRLYKYSPKMAPIAEDLAPRVLCLPTDIKEEDCKRLIKLINSPDKNIASEA